MIGYLKDARFGKKGVGYYGDGIIRCGECIYFRAGAGCTERGLSFVKFETSATFCDDFVDVDEVRE